jgi:hypothetical protein
MIRDRDRIYGAVVTGRLRAMGIRDKPIAGVPAVSLSQGRFALPPSDSIEKKFPRIRAYSTNAPDLTQRRFQERPHLAQSRSTSSSGCVKTPTSNLHVEILSRLRSIGKEHYCQSQ